MSADPSLSPTMLGSIRIVLVEPQHPGNIGSAARAMLTMGLTELTLVAPKNFPDVQARVLAAGALDTLDRARVVPTLEDAVADCAYVLASSARPRHLGDEPLKPWEAASRLIEEAGRGSVALVFGRERTGLFNEELDRCHAHTLIPANPDYSSLNLANAVQLYAYEIRKAAVAAPEVSAKRDNHWYRAPTAEQVENLYVHFEKVLMATGFLDPANPRLLMRRIRMMFNRARLDLNEVNILRGILTSVEQPKRRTRGGAPADDGDGGA